jgi:tRNA threonylcarbamoyl adenosine modification protein YeaZ
MPTVLAIESSTPRASLVVMTEDTILFEGGCVSDRHHNALLFAPLEEAIKALGDRRIDEVIVGTGPGSYSGTRVGIAAGQGVAMVHGCPAVGLSSLLAAGRDGATAIGDARRGSAWTARVRAGELPDPQLLPTADLAGVLGEAEGIFTFEEPERFGLAKDVVVEQVVPTARLLVQAWWALSEEQREELRSIPPQPAYLKPPHITEAKKGHPLLRARK